MNASLNRSVAVWVMRLLLGLIFLMQGFGKVFTWGVEGLYNMEFFLGTYQNLLPIWLIKATAYYTSYVELLGGILLIAGFKRNIALYALASVLVIVTFGHGLATPIWDLAAVMWRAVLLIGLLLLPEEWDRFSVDQVLRNRKIKAQ